MADLLARPLVDAAAEAIKAQEPELKLWEREDPAIVAAVARSRETKASAAVAAVLETLAADLHESARHHDALGSIDVAGLRRLAAEAKEQHG